MSRYSDIPILKTTKGPRYYSSTKYPMVTESTNDLYIITQQGDRLDNLAAQFYNDPSLYWIFQISNNLNRDSLFPPIGLQMRIPQNLTQILQDFYNINQ
jgi:hypothetical protein